MTAIEEATQLKQLIQAGDLLEIEELLHSATAKQVQKIEFQFHDRSPIELAIDAKQEDIVIYLIEKGFKIDQIYHFPGQQCDQWCYQDHQDESCPIEYTLIEFAEGAHMSRVIALVQQIQNGSRKPGDGLRDQAAVKPVQANKMEQLIKEGKLRDIRNLLDTVTCDDIIYTETQKCDPVVLAVRHTQEEVAIYLIEMGFNFTQTFNYPDKHCDQWCHYEHGDAKCPCQYDALELARDKHLTRVVSLIQDIQQGLRTPGDGLVDSSTKAAIMHKTHNEQAIKGRKVSPYKGRSPSYTPLSEAKYSITSSTISKNGDTSLHQCANESAAKLYACVNEGINVNAKNFDGDTALHIAVNKENLDTAKALCSSGADLTIRNKLSQTPSDKAKGDMEILLKSYKRGVVSAIMKGEQSAFTKICRLWPNPDAIVKGDRTVLQLAQEQSDKGPGQQACYNLLKENKNSLRLAHAVLSEDADKVKQVIRTPSASCNINVRYKDKCGETPLSCAVDRCNLEIVKLLVDSEMCNVNIRVRENSWTDHTVPLKFKSLTRDCPVEIWRILENLSDASQLTARDCFGNTGLLRAILNNKPASFIKLMVKASAGHSLTHRNTEGLHARELAMKLNRSDIVDVIDQFLCENPNYFLINLTVAFYGKPHLDIRNADGESLVSIARAKGTEADIKAVTQCQDVEASGVRLFEAAARGDITQVARGNTANYQDKNGYTALTRAIVFCQVKSVEALLTTRPVLCCMPDNYGRYPLHYAYALPEKHGSVLVKLLVERFGDEKDHNADKDGRLPAEYQKSRDSDELLQILHDARTLNAYGKRCEPLADLPEDAVVL